MLRFHNTLSGQTEDFSPLTPGLVKMYNCGPTVYGRQHAGNLAMFVFTDVLRRTLESEGYNVRQVINFTDFGHLTSDADEGEDKMQKGLRAEGLTPSLENMHKLGRMYAEIFLQDIKALNVEFEDIAFPYASEYVPQQIELIKKLEEKGFTYQGDQGVYFDTSKFPTYGKLGQINLAGQMEGARVANTEKKHPTDFILWKKGEMGWESPWGKGFPGWHIECSAMILALLGEQIDIHTGGIEHVGVHHQNEIAQSEAATGKSPFSKFWLHRAHLQLDGGKIAKSEGNVVYLSDMSERGFSPLAFRYFLLGAHYRTPVNFTWEALGAAQNALDRLRRLMVEYKHSGEGAVNAAYKLKFGEALEDDLNTPVALAVVWELIKDDAVSPADKYATLIDFDRVLGLKLDNGLEGPVPQEVADLLKEREEARINKNFARSDELRDRIKALGYEIEDTPSGQTTFRL